MPRIPEEFDPHNSSEEDTTPPPGRYPVDRKATLRAAVRQRRRLVDPDERSRASTGAAAHLLDLPEVVEARAVALYAALREEADPAPALPTLLARGVRVVLPRVAGAELELVVVTDFVGLRRGFRGIPEPAGPAIPPDDLDVVVVPGVAFDRAGGRLGQGGGHYDRLLARLPARTVRVGYCLEVQLLPAVPRDPHDEPVDVVVTERGAVRTNAR